MEFDEFIKKLKEETKRLDRSNVALMNAIIEKLAQEYKPINSQQDIKQSLDDSNNSIVIDSSKGVCKETKHSRDAPADNIQAKQGYSQCPKCKFPVQFFIKKGLRYWRCPKCQAKQNSEEKIEAHTQISMNAFDKGVELGKAQAKKDILDIIVNWRNSMVIKKHMQVWDSDIEELKQSIKKL